MHVRVLLLIMTRPRRSNFSLRNFANQLTDEERQIAREERRVGVASQTHEQREAARETARLETRNRRANQTDQQRDSLRSASRNTSSVDLNRAAFLYDCTINYSSHPFICIGLMDVVCEHCAALKFAGETPGLCCLNGIIGSATRAIAFLASWRNTRITTFSSEH